LRLSARHDRDARHRRPAGPGPRLAGLVRGTCRICGQGACDMTPQELRRPWLANALRLLAGVGLLVAVLWWLAPDWGEVAARARPRVAWLGIGLLGTTVGTLAASARWMVLTEQLGD